MYSTPVSRQTDKFESPKLPIYSKILRDLRVPFPFPKSEGNFWAETSGGDDAAASVQCYSLISNFHSRSRSYGPFTLVKYSGVPNNSFETIINFGVFGPAKQPY